ncbi:YdcF family protein [Lentilactobacillus sp. SPB1-3]|uniref:YdcF family protein n=1 Tax=Lentilactobacillus terminaliae TaxID=3003483 RepID=A0ACD5DDE7_9LACO|nr:YdcF family protein [Lentilactobacillus sp. SPB1-3]MCZ0977763.1 YdcF family protein [Lentilactobacillus sp. SPB1-3]
MALIISGLLLSIIAGLLLRKDRRNFFAGLILFGGLLLILLSSVISILNAIVGMAPESTEAVVLFILIGMIGFPILAGAALIINSRVMEVKEGKSLTAKLSLIFGLNLIVIVLLGYLVLKYASAWPTAIVAVMFWTLMVDISLTFIFMGYLFYSFMYQMFPVKYPADYVITLGAGVRSDEVSPLLKSRLDRAIQYFKNFSTNNSHMIPSGGQGPDEPYSEAYVMAKYLKNNSIPEERIILEDKSTSTYENMLFSKHKIEADWQEQGQSGTPKIVFSTNNYHVLRGAIYAKRAGLNAQGVGAPTSFYFLPSAMLREYIAILSIYRKTTFGIGIFWALISALFFIR